LLKLLAKGKRVADTRIEDWLREIGTEFTLRDARDGRTVATAWLIAELRAGHLPDFRATKSREADARLINEYEQLTERLKPIFRAARSAATRKRLAASIIAEVTGRSVDPQELPTDSSLSRFLHEILRTTPVNLSRARSRARRRAVGLLTKAKDLLELACRDVSTQREARAVLSMLRREVPSAFARHDT
jgi:hypothetical protein